MALDDVEGVHVVENGNWNVDWLHALDDMYDLRVHLNGRRHVWGICYEMYRQHLKINEIVEMIFLGISSEMQKQIIVKHI